MTCSFGLVLVHVRLYWSPIIGGASGEIRVTELEEKSENKIIILVLYLTILTATG